LLTEAHSSGPKNSATNKRIAVVLLAIDANVVVDDVVDSQLLAHVFFLRLSVKM
jgi:hypothetical protein